MSLNSSMSNKCIGDDTKAATRQSLNCIKNKKNNMADGILTPCNVACRSGIVTVNSPSGSTLQCDTSSDTIALNCLVFEKIAFLHFDVKIQDGGF